METITCGEERIQAKEIESIGGYLNPTTNYDDTLYRSRSGQYYLKEERSIPLPQNAVFTLPRDRERMSQMRQNQVSIRKISEKEALLWCVNALNDDRLRKRFAALIKRLA